MALPVAVQGIQFFSMSKTEQHANAKITGRQVGLLIARGAEANKHGQALLEFLEFECDVAVAKLEDVPAYRLDYILKQLRDAS